MLLLDTHCVLYSNQELCATPFYGDRAMEPAGVSMPAAVNLEFGHTAEA